MENKIEMLLGDVTLGQWKKMLEENGDEIYEYLESLDNDE